MEPKVRVRKVGIIIVYFFLNFLYYLLLFYVAKENAPAIFNRF